MNEVRFLKKSLFLKVMLFVHISPFPVKCSNKIQRPDPFYLNGLSI